MLKNHFGQSHRDFVDFGTRLFPATNATKKELFPIVDSNGIAKSAILFIVEEALKVGIEAVRVFAGTP